MRKTQGFNTRAVHAGYDPDDHVGSVALPIYQSSTFSFESADEGAARFAGTAPGYRYTRLGNPTVRALAQAVCELEGGYDTRALSASVEAHLAVLAGMTTR